MIFSRNESNAQSGIALLELSLILPILILVIVGSFECNRMLNSYLSTTRIAYEVVRYGISYPGLEECANCDEITMLFGQYPGHEAIKDKLIRLMDKQSDIFSDVVYKTTTSFNPDNGIVTISISLDYKPLFVDLILGGQTRIPMQINASGKYLMLESG